MQPISKILRLAVALTVTLLSGCDNVEWGGVDFAVVPPPPTGPSEPQEVEEVQRETVLPTGPILYYVQVAEPGGAVMTPVAEITGDTLRPLGDADWEMYGASFIGQFLRTGSEFTVFRRGARAGTFVVRDATLPAAGSCPALPRAVGTLELAARGDTLRPREFLAMAKSDAPDSRGRPQPQPQINRGMQIVGPILAERMLRARRAQLPGNWRAAMTQLFPFPLADFPDPGFTATFVVGDDFGVGPWESQVAYSLFFVAIPKSQLGYDTAYVSFLDFPTQGKETIRSVDYLDWDRDGQVEILLQAMGERNAWFAAAGQVGSDWRRIFDGRCPAAPQPAPAPADTPAAAVPAASRAATPPRPRQREAQPETRPAPQPLGNPSFDPAGAGGRQPPPSRR